MSPYTKYKLKRILAFLGWTKGRPEYTMRDSLRRMKAAGFSPASIIDVGVADGTFDLYSAFPESRVLLVEPMAEFEPDLQAICRRVDGEYEIAAAAREDGKAEIGFDEYLHGASLVAGGERHREVTTVRIDTLVRKHNLPGPILVKADVQGAELEVIAGAERTLEMAEVVILEVLFFDTVGNGVTVAGVIEAMNKRGFVPHDFFDALLRPIDGSVGAADIAFVKAGGQFRQTNQWASPEQASRIRFMQRVRRMVGL